MAVQVKALLFKEFDGVEAFPINPAEKKTKMWYL